AVGARRLEESPVARIAARSLLEVDLARAHLHARLAERQNDDARFGVVAHRLPVLAAGGARARLDPLADFHLDDVGAVLRCASGRIDVVPDVLEDRLLVTEVLARAAIQFPENAWLAGGEQHLLIADVDQDALEDFVEIERLGWRMLE